LSKEGEKNKKTSKAEEEKGGGEGDVQPHILPYILGPNSSRNMSKGWKIDWGEGRGRESRKG
jgi:hypothetical protein